MDNEPTNHKSGFLEENSNNRKDAQGNQNQVDNDQLHQTGLISWPEKNPLGSLKNCIMHHGSQQEPLEKRKILTTFFSSFFNTLKSDERVAIIESVIKA